MTVPFFGISEEATRLGVKFDVAIIDGITLKRKHEGLEKLKDNAEEFVRNIDIGNNEILTGYRELFKKIGSPKVISSPEYLVSLIQTKGKLPQINTVVDAYNMISAQRLVVASAHDLSKLSGNVMLRISTGENFLAIGETQDEIVPEGEWLVADDKHVLCRLNIKQSELSKVTNTTNDLLIYVQGNEITTSEYLHKALIEICEIITRFNGGTYSFIPRIS